MFCVTAPWWFISLDFFLDQHHNFWFGFIFRKLYPGLKENLEQFRKHLKESSQEMAALKVWQLQGIYCELCIELLSLLFLCKVLSYMLCNFLPVNLSHYLFLQRYFYNWVLRGCVLLVLVLSSIFLILNPLGANSNQQLFSPNNIHTLSRDKVMRINKMITKGKMPAWSFIKFSHLVL